MTQYIWKFILPIEDRSVIEMPTNSQILTVQMQGNDICIWALVYPNHAKVEHTFEMFGTGHPVYNDMGIERKYIGTVQMFGGDLVYHIFERLD